MKNIENLNELSETEKQMLISKLRRADGWRFADYLIWKHLIDSAEKE